MAGNEKEGRIGPGTLVPIGVALSVSVVILSAGWAVGSSYLGMQARLERLTEKVMAIEARQSEWITRRERVAWEDTLRLLNPELRIPPLLQR